MTSIGHTLTGMSLAVLTVRETGTPWWRRPAFHIFALAANIPDLPLPGCAQWPASSRPSIGVRWARRWDVACEGVFAHPYIAPWSLSA